MAYSNRSNNSISRTSFGKTADNEAVEIYTLRNSHGMEMRLATYGGIVVSLTAPDRNGQFVDVVLGHDNLDDYLKYNFHFGALIGRYANRIGGGKFSLNGKTYTLAKNSGENTLHGGVKGFDKVVWKAKPLETAHGPAIELSYLSKDGEEGFPGNLTVKALHTLTDENELRIDFAATTDATTVCNLTNHSYFNLAGKGDVLNHEVQINAGRFTPMDSTLIATGELKSVDGTPFDFRKPAKIGARIGDPQLTLTKGYDINFVIDEPLGKLGLQARVYEPASGRVLEVLSTQPGVQFFTANNFNGSFAGKNGWAYQKHAAFCLEAQHFPDSPNKPQFPSTELKPGQIYQNTIIYRFLTK
ncbi:MAG: aldose epimerase family protein [Verrucomicrobiota bacterium]|jgi:aldose 1-epimerase